MRASPHSVLALYLAAMAATLPFLPGLVIWLGDRFGPAAVTGPLYVGLAGAVLLPAFRLLVPPRPRPPWPHLLYLLLAAGAATAALTLASSPVSRIHLAEYGVLGILVLRALPGPRTPRRYAQAFLASSLVGLADEVVQHFVPRRVFDWYDVALNAAASLLGVLAAAWWSCSAARRPRGGGRPRRDAAGTGGPASGWR